MKVKLDCFTTCFSRQMGHGSVRGGLQFRRGSSTREEKLIPGFTADKPCDFTNSLDCFSALDFSFKGVELHHL